MTTAYPLSWPPGWPRTKMREQSRYRTALPAALKGLNTEIKLFGGSKVVLSSNVTLGSEHPSDPGVVAYFEHAGQPIAIPCDRWSSVQDNVRAISSMIGALREIERTGAKHMIKAMFTGLLALPAPGTRGWREVLGIAGEHVTVEGIRAKQKEMALLHHPDRPGGNEARMAEINAAADAALREIGA